jgi:hypothetical protein
MENKKLIKLIRKCNGKVLKFKQLQKESKYAMAYYMSIDGEAWKVPPSLEYSSMIFRDLKKVISWYTKRHGNVRFGYVEIPREEFLDLFGKQRYIYENVIVKNIRKEIWPVILDLNAWDEKKHPNDITIIQDGWRRFYDYIAMGLKMIPCLYYIK